MICVPLTNSTTEGMLGDAARSAGLGADMVEFRLDYPAAPDVAELVARTPLPAIFTCRSPREGGRFKGTEAARLALLQEAVDRGADYVDVELDSVDGLRRRPSTRTIVSVHDLERTPDDLDAVWARIAAERPDVVKIATTANDIGDSLRVLELLKSATLPTIALAMGERGVVSRILAAKFGAFLTFASLEADRGSAPGQLTVAELVGLYRYREINADTQLFGVVAKPVAHSMSPLIHNAAFAVCALNCVYVPLLVDDVTDFIARARRVPFSGLSVTIPHKEEALASADEVDDLTRRIGALNTLVNRDGRLVGTNTDCCAALGAMEDALRGAASRGGAGPDKQTGGPDIPVRHRDRHECLSRHASSPLAGKRVALIGAGGTTRAVAAALVDAGAHVTLFNRTASKARTLAEEFGCRWAPLEHLDDARPDVVANTTSVGMHPNVDASIVPTQLLRKGVLVFDAVYNPIETKLIREARERGCLTVTGLEMFVAQAVRQFELFTGRSAPVELMRRVVEERLKAE